MRKKLLDLWTFHLKQYTGYKSPDWVPAAVLAGAAEQVWLPLTDLAAH